MVLNSLRSAQPRFFEVTALPHKFAWLCGEATGNWRIILIIWLYNIIAIYDYIRLILIGWLRSGLLCRPLCSHEPKPQAKKHGAALWVPHKLVNAGPEDLTWILLVALKKILKRKKQEEETKKLTICRKQMTATDYRLTAATVQRLFLCLPSTTPIRTSCSTLRQGAQLYFTCKLFDSREGSATSGIIRHHPVNHLTARQCHPSKPQQHAGHSQPLSRTCHECCGLRPVLWFLNNCIRPWHTEHLIAIICKHYPNWLRYDLHCWGALGLRSRERMSN